MTTHRLLRALFVTGFAGALAASQALATTPAAIAPPSELFRTIEALDTQVFDAYNQCADKVKLQVFGNYFTPGLEF